MRATLFILLMGLLSACASYRSGVPVPGEPFSLSLLEGSWKGEYRDDAGNSGELAFDLRARADTAFGEAFLVALDTLETASQDPGAEPYLRTVQEEVLPVTFVHSGHNRIRGRLEPYRDAQQGCVLYTILDGSVRGNRIEGTYTAQSPQTCVVRTGSWYVVRQ